MRRLLSVLSAGALVAAASLAATAGPVSAADPQIWTYGGTSAGSQINALGTTISSGPTANSNLSDTVVPNQTGIEIAKVHVAGLLDVGAVTSGQQATAFGDGVKISSRVKVAGINLLGGAIKVDAIDGESYATANSSGVAGGSNTTFVRLSIGGNQLDTDGLIKPNTTIDLGDLAKVVINESAVSTSQPGKSVIAAGIAVHITLLKNFAGAPAGAEIKLGITQATIVPSGPSDVLSVGGFSYGSFAGVGVGDDITVLSQPTGMLLLPSTGTKGVPYKATTAAVKVPGLVDLGVIETSVNAKTIAGFADVETAGETARVNLLNGLITADAVDVNTHVTNIGGVKTAKASTKFINLVVAGIKIPINPDPNTLINIPGIANVWINQQYTQAVASKPTYAVVVGIRITLTTKYLGLPIGADIQAGTAASYIYD